MFPELRKVERVEDALLGHTAFAGHENPPLNVVDFFGGVGVRVDAEQASEF